MVFGRSSRQQTPLVIYDGQGRPREYAPPIAETKTLLTVGLGSVDERPVTLMIEDKTKVLIQVGCAPGERDVMKFELEQWQHLQTRVLEGLLMVTG